VLLLESVQRSKTGVAAGMSLEIVVRATVTVRVKWARVNSVFLVQLRKKMATDFRGSTRIKQRLKDTSFYRWMALVLA
jgi:hypothetical protein